MTGVQSVLFRSAPGGVPEIGEIYPDCFDVRHFAARNIPQRWAPWECARLRKDTLLNMGLQSSPLLNEVVVTGSKIEMIQESTGMGTINLPITQIKAMPALMGEIDVMKVLQLLPGVQAGSEGSSGLYVRGGGADQNLILLDGVPVYNASHLYGFFSTFNADAINHVELVKGGFPARYGGRLSSVVDRSEEHTSELQSQ